MRCPLCSSTVLGDAPVCQRCGAALAPASEEELFARLGIERMPAAPDPTEPDGFGGDALILGVLGTALDPASADVQAQILAQIVPPTEALEADTGVVQRFVLSAPVYIDQTTAALLRPDAVPAPLDGDRSTITPIEQHVLAHVNGQRPVARIRARTGLSDDDLRIALAMLADRQLVRMAGVARVDPGAYASAASAPSAPSATRGSPGEGLRPALGDDDPGELVAVAHEDPTDAEIALPSAVEGIAFPFVPITIESDEAPELPTLTRPASPAASDAARPAPPARPVARRPPETRRPVEVRLYEEAAEKEAQGDSDAALELLRRAVNVNPEAAPVHNRLGVLLALRKRDYKTAALHLMRAVELDPKNETYQSNLSKIMSHLSSGGGDPVAPTKTGVGRALLKFLSRK